MKNIFIYLITILVLLFSQSCSTSGENQNPDKIMTYKDEVKNLASVCYKMKDNGDLPGVESGVDVEDQFKVGALRVYDSDKLAKYPFTLNCIVMSKNRSHRFSFRKETRESSWNLIE